MVHLTTLDPTTANVTHNTFALNFSLVDSPFGLRELESDLIFPPRNGMSWNLSMRTSDIVILLLTILFLTFAIDRYLFKSRYLVHIGGATQEEDYAFVYDEKAHLHEKEALNLESGQKGSSSGDTSLEPESDDDLNLPTSTAFSRWTHGAIYILFIFFLVANSDGRKKNLEKKEAEGKADLPPHTGWWDRITLPPRLERLFMAIVIPLTLLYMLAAVVFHLLFWPLLLTLVILLQCALLEEINPGVTISWESIAIKSTLQLAIWTIFVVGLLLKPNRIQGMLWKSIKWTHAVSWWMFWGLFESYLCGKHVAQCFGIDYSQNTMKVVFFVLRPSLVAYLYSGIVRDVLIAVRMGKYMRDIHFCEG